MTSNFLDKRDGCVCDTKQTNVGWIAMNLADEEMIELNLGQLAEIGSCRVFLEKAVSGWNAQEKCHPVLSRLSSQCSTHFLDICRKPFPLILDNVSRQCLSANMGVFLTRNQMVKWL